jgi:hypothetical protein
MADFSPLGGEILTFTSNEGAQRLAKPGEFS